jgi:magnesium transporter
MISIYYRNLKDKSMQILDKPRTGSWIYAEAPTEQELAYLAEKFDLEEGHLRDAVDMDEMPRLEIEGDDTYVFTRYAINNDGQIQTAPILIVVTAKTVITVSPKPIPGSISFTQAKLPIVTTQKAKLFLQIIAQVIGSYGSGTNSVNRQIRSARARLNVQTVSNKDFVQFVALEDVMNDFLAELVPTSAMLSGLLSGKKNLAFYEEDTDLIEDLMLSTRQLIETCKGNLKTIGNIRAAYGNIMTNNLNRQIKLLTSLTIILTIPTIVASIFGMNVAVPFANNPHAFGAIVLATAAFSGLLLWIFSRNKWL